MYCLSNFCCVCLNKNLNLININKLDDDNIPIINKLIFIVFGHERLDTEIVKLICAPCLEELRTAYKFKTKCLISNELALGYNSQLKFFTGSVTNACDLNVTLNKNDSLIIAEYLQNVVKKKYKPKPLSKQKDYVGKNAVKTQSKKRFKCKYCCLIYFSNVARLIHYNKVHKKRLNLVCSICKSIFHNEQFLKVHMRKIHFDESKNLCRHCNNCFTTRKQFLNHMKLRHNYNNFTCEICNTKYLKEANYKQHLKLHAENKIFPQKKTKKRVRKENKSLKMITRYLVCKICDGIFINAAELEKHARTHDNSLNLMENGLNEGPPPGRSDGNLSESIFEPKIEIKEEDIEVVTSEPAAATNNFNFRIQSVVSIENGENSGNKEDNTENNLQNDNTFELVSSDKIFRQICCNLCFKNFKYEFSLNQHLRRCHSN